jgi:Bifunctional DNA primase/polymerase, N-terminal/Primase C terminal 1 (PriCT-1)
MTARERLPNQCLFAEWQPRYAEHGIPTFPVRDKRPAVRGYLKLGPIASARLTEKFSNADSIGFALGGRSKITVLDVDTPNERVLADVLDRHGRTPIIVRSGSGNYQCWYRWNRERRQIRPFGEKPIDVLGGGFVVAPPSRGTNSNYRFIEGSLDDLDSLPVLRGIEIATSPLSPASIVDGGVTEGHRNASLWRHCMQSARYCDDVDAVLDVARTHNAEFMPPLTDSEVMKVAKSAWDYTERGANRFGRHGVFFDTDEVNRLITSDSDAFVLLAFLRANNRPESVFMVANGLAETLGWGLNRLRRARNRVEETEIEMVRRPSTFKGAALYRWKAKGGQK